MKCKDVQTRLDAFVDGELALDERLAVTSHVDGCGQCRSELDGLIRVLEHSKSLKPSIEPARDLWPEIAEQIDRGKVVEGRFGKAVVRTAVAAAAAAVVVVAVLVGYTVGRQQNGTVALGETPTPEIVAVGFEPGSFEYVEAEFTQARAELIAILDQRRHTLSPETLRVVDGNLRVIDDAIEQISEALGRDPDNPQLSHRLASAYRQQIQLLRTAASLPSEI